MYLIFTGSRGGTYHWDDTFDSNGVLQFHSDKNPDSKTPICKIHPERKVYKNLLWSVTGMDAKMYLFSGVTMSAELEANAKTERRFITVGGYIDIGGRTFSISNYRKKYPINKEDIKFYFHIYSIPNYFIDDDLDVHENDCIEYIYVEILLVNENLECEIKKAHSTI